MTKLFTLKPVLNFHRVGRVKACGNCKYLQYQDDGLDLICSRPIRAARGKPRPHWEFRWNTKTDQIYEEIWTHVCDRWVKKEI